MRRLVSVILCVTALWGCGLRAPVALQTCLAGIPAERLLLPELCDLPLGSMPGELLDAWRNCQDRYRDARLTINLIRNSCGGDDSSAG